MSSNKLTDQQKQEITQRYQNGESCNRISKDYDCSSQNISYILKKRGVVVKNHKNQLIRKYQLNENYFDVIDCEHKAYWLGFLYADGSVWTEHRRERVTIFLQERDRYILELFLKDIGSDSPLSCRPPKQSTHQYQYGVTINNKHMSNQLSNLGCHQNKTFTLKFPSDDIVPNELIHHFIRGFWDGDGSILITQQNKKPKLILSCVGTVDICNNIQQILKKELNINSRINIDKRHQKTTRQMFIAGNIQAQKFANWLYKDATIYLTRKYEKIQEFRKLAAEHGLQTVL